jgi:hypothetical protein
LTTCRTDIDRFSLLERFFHTGPKSLFKISYSRAEIYLNFYVREKYFKAEMDRNQPAGLGRLMRRILCFTGRRRHLLQLRVQRDRDMLHGCGTGRHDSMPARLTTFRVSERFSSMGKKPFKEIQGDIYWELLQPYRFLVFSGIGLSFRQAE